MFYRCRLFFWKTDRIFFESVKTRIQFNELIKTRNILYGTGEKFHILYMIL